MGKKALALPIFFPKLFFASRSSHRPSAPLSPFVVLHLGSHPLVDWVCHGFLEEIVDVPFGCVSWWWWGRRCTWCVVTLAEDADIVVSPMVRSGALFAPFVADHTLYNLLALVVRVVHVHLCRRSNRVFSPQRPQPLTPLRRSRDACVVVLVVVWCVASLATSFAPVAVAVALAPFASTTALSAFVVEVLLVRTALCGGVVVWYKGGKSCGEVMVTCWLL